MKTILSIICIIIAYVSFCSCTTTYSVSKQNDYTRSYVGATHQQIVSHLGAPDRQSSDGNGGTILIYEKTYVTSSSRSVATMENMTLNSYTPGNRTVTSSTSNTSYVHFFIDRNGNCYQVKTNHRQNLTKFSPAKTITLGVFLIGGAITALSLLK